jgi:hypothetical protein
MGITHPSNYLAFGKGRLGAVLFSFNKRLEQYQKACPV